MRVVVIGGGIGGLTLALALALALAKRGLALALAPLGVADAVLAAGRPIARAAIVDRTGRVTRANRIVTAAPRFGQGAR